MKGDLLDRFIARALGVPGGLRPARDFGSWSEPALSAPPGSDLAGPGEIGAPLLAAPVGVQAATDAMDPTVGGGTTVSAAAPGAVAGWLAAAGPSAEPTPGPAAVAAPDGPRATAVWPVTDGSAAPPGPVPGPLSLPVTPVRPAPGSQRPLAAARKAQTVAPEVASRGPLPGTATDPATVHRTPAPSGDPSHRPTAALPSAAIVGSETTSPNGPTARVLRSDAVPAAVGPATAFPASAAPAGVGAAVQRTDSADRSDQGPPPPTAAEVTVSIGRLEVRVAGPARPAPAPPRAVGSAESRGRRQLPVTLQDYQARRRGGAT